MSKSDIENWLKWIADLCFEDKVKGLKSFSVTLSVLSKDKDSFPETQGTLTDCDFA